MQQAATPRSPTPQVPPASPGSTRRRSVGWPWPPAPSPTASRSTSRSRSMSPNCRPSSRSSSAPIPVRTNCSPRCRRTRSRSSVTTGIDRGLQSDGRPARSAWRRPSSTSSASTGEDGVIANLTGDMALDRWADRLRQGADRRPADRHGGRGGDADLPRHHRCRSSAKACAAGGSRVAGASHDRDAMLDEAGTRAMAHGDVRGVSDLLPAGSVARADGRATRVCGRERERCRWRARSRRSRTVIDTANGESIETDTTFTESLTAMGDQDESLFFLNIQGIKDAIEVLRSRLDPTGGRSEPRTPQGVRGRQPFDRRLTGCQAAPADQVFPPRWFVPHEVLDEGSAGGDATARIEWRSVSGVVMKKRVVQAEGFEVVDDQGRVRARIGLASDDAPFLSFHDPDGGFAPGSVCVGRIRRVGDRRRRGQGPCHARARLGWVGEPRVRRQERQDPGEVRPRAGTLRRSG